MRRVRQRTASHCGPAVLQMLLSFHDVQIDQDAFVSAARVARKIEKHGMTVKELAVATKKIVLQVTFWHKRNAKFSDINRIVNQYHCPVGVEWQGIFGRSKGKSKDDDDGHYSIVTGFDKEQEKIYLADPYGSYIKRDRRIAFSRFKKRWWDYNQVINPETKKSRRVKDYQMLFLITLKKEQFPKKLGFIKTE